MEKELNRDQEGRKSTASEEVDGGSSSGWAGGAWGAGHEAEPRVQRSRTMELNRIRNRGITRSKSQ